MVPIYTRYPEAPGTAFQVMLAPNPTSSAPSTGAVMTAQSGLARRVSVVKLISVHPVARPAALKGIIRTRSEEHTSELQSLMRISYAVFCLKKKKSQTRHDNTCQ